MSSLIDAIINIISHFEILKYLSIKGLNQKRKTKLKNLEVDLVIGKKRDSNFREENGKKKRSLISSVLIIPQIFPNLLIV